MVQKFEGCQQDLPLPFPNSYIPNLHLFKLTVDLSRFICTGKTVSYSTRVYENMNERFN